MKLLADECYDASLVNALRNDAHEVLYVLEQMRGVTDREVLARASAEERILLTEDKDFGELVNRFGLPAYGIILLRFDPQQRSLKVYRLRELLSQAPHRLEGHLTVLEADKTRFRPLY